MEMLKSLSLQKLAASRLNLIEEPPLTFFLVLPSYSIKHLFWALHYRALLFNHLESTSMRLE